MATTKQSLRTGLAALAALGATALAAPAHAQGVIKIGEVNSYKAQPLFLEPYKKGMDLAVEEINKAGGINGKKVELVSRDDNGNPGDAVRVAEELVSRQKVDVLTGAFLSNIGLALTDFAKQKKFFYLASEPLTDKIVWADGNRYTFRLRPSTYMQVAMLVPEAAAMKKKRWALVFPNYEYGQSAAATFKQLLKAAQPDVEFVAEQAPPLGRVDAGSVVQALADAKPDAIFNVLFAADLAKFVREGNTRGLFQGREVVSLLTGEPEYIDPLKAETPTGWVVTGRSAGMSNRAASRSASALLRWGTSCRNGFWSLPPSFDVRPRSPFTARILASTQYRLPVFFDTAANSQCFASPLVSSSKVNSKPALMRMFATMSS